MPRRGAAPPTTESPVAILPTIRASRSWAVEGDQGQIVVRCSRERSGKLTLWLRNRGAGDRNSQGIDGESADGEEGENDFGEHDDMECRKEEQIITAPGLKFRRLERRTGVSCTAAEKTRECTSTLL